MATWTFTDGTELKSGGSVSGGGKVASALREAIREKSGVQLFPHPDKTVPVDPGNDYLLDVLAREVAMRFRVGVFSEYERDLDDAPPALREEIRDKREALHRAPYGRVY
ncbi:MAG TPA: hypothetical protein VGY54_13835 [Polyangiaceae bacterium]|jgi:hypothetical protein|nr:hypothetical protein [Polyangiaceae bacterium]